MLGEVFKVTKINKFEEQSMIYNNLHKLKL